MIGTTLSHFRIIDKLGEGGMGEVWLAEDTRLGRKVALKILPPKSAEKDDRRRRFEDEARAASALNHPGIAHIYDVGEADGILVPGGFGSRGIEGKICAARYARENKVPYFGICLGMQIAVVEFARHVAELKLNPPSHP